MRDKAMSFTALERAFWRFVDQNCPHSLYSRHRYTWLRAIRRFEHQGIAWERCTQSAPPGSAAPGAYLVIFTADDGTVVQDWLSPSTIYRAA